MQTLHHEKDERAYRNISHRERRLCCGRAVLSVCQYKSGRTSRCTGWCAGTPSPTSVEQPRLRRDKLSGVAASERRAQRLSFCRADSCGRQRADDTCRRRADDRRRADRADDRADDSVQTTDDVVRRACRRQRADDTRVQTTPCRRPRADDVQTTDESRQVRTRDDHAGGSSRQNF